MPNYIIDEFHSTLTGARRSLVLPQFCDTLLVLPESAKA
jgi:hypothetical protein